MLDLHVNLTVRMYKLIYILISFKTISYMDRRDIVLNAD